MQASGIAVREVRTPAGFDALREAWERVAARMEMRSPIADWEWNRCWWDAFGAGGRLRILAFEAGGDTLGIAQLYERRHRLGPLTATSLVPVGWEDAGRQPMTEQLELLFPPEHRTALFVALAGWLRRRPWAIAWLPGLRVDDRLPAWMASHVVARCAPVPFHHRTLPPTWDEFVSGLNKSMRDNVKYYPRLMARHGHDYTFEVARTPAQVAYSFPILLDLHRRRSEVATGVPHWNYFRGEGRREFVAEMIERLAAHDEVRIGLLRVRDEPVSAYLWLERGSTMYLYRSGYAPDWSKYSVALVVVLEALKDGMRRGLDRVEFLRGGGQLKERWDTEVRLLRHVMLARVPRVTRRLLAARAARQPVSYEVA